MGLFDDIAGATIEGSGVKLPPGVYGLEINRCHARRSQNPQSKQNNRMIAIIEFRVIQSDNPAVQIGDTKYSLVEHIEEKYGQGAIKALICAVFGVAHADEAGIKALEPYIKRLAEASLDARNLLGPIANGAGGMVVACQIIQKTSKQNFAYGKNVYFPHSQIPPHVQGTEMMRRLEAHPRPVALPPQAPDPFLQAQPPQGYQYAPAQPPQGYQYAPQPPPQPPQWGPPAMHMGTPPVSSAAPAQPPLVPPGQGWQYGSGR